MVNEKEPIKNSQKTDMPYPGVSEKDLPKMERCVKDLMVDSKMKEKYPDEKERKSHAIAICHNSVSNKSEGESNDVEKAVWTTAYVNTLPDSSFAYVEPGDKDGEGKTTPRSKRHLPFRDKNGKVDAAHVRNALARLDQTQIPASAKASAHSKLVAAAKQVGIEVASQKLSVNHMKGGELEMTDKKEEVKKAADAPKVEEKPVEQPKVEEKTVEAPVAPAAPAEAPAEKPAEEVKKAEEPKKEEVVEKKAPPAKDESKEDPKEEAKETPDEENAEDAKKVEHGKPGHECGPKCPSYKAEKVDKVIDETSEKIQKLNDSVIALSAKLELLTSLIKQAPAVGASAKSETPKEVVVETPKEEVKKSDTSSEGTAELLKAIGELKTGLEERLTKLEKMPAPSKVVVYPRELGGNAEDAGELSLEKINKELESLEKMKNEDPNNYMNKGYVDRAFELVKMRKQMSSKK